MIFFKERFFQVLVLIVLISGLSCDLTNEQDLSCGLILTVTEQMPELVGGLSELQSNIIDPEKALTDSVEGRVTVGFSVNKIGQPFNLYILRGLSLETNEEAIRVVRMTRYDPMGMQNGEPVCVNYSLPVVFRLD